MTAKYYLVVAFSAEEFRHWAENRGLTVNRVGNAVRRKDNERRGELTEVYLYTHYEQSYFYPEPDMEIIILAGAAVCMEPGDIKLLKA